MRYDRYSRVASGASSQTLRLPTFSHEYDKQDPLAAAEGVDHVRNLAKVELLIIDALSFVPLSQTALIFSSS